jgi:hypothetical protein
MMPDKSLRVWVAVFALMVFLGGMGAGILVTRFVPGRGGPRAALGRPGAAMGRANPAFLVDRLASELDLTAEQRARVEAVLSTRRPRLEQFHREVRDRFETEQREMRDELRKILTPAQQERFDAWVRRTPPRGMDGRPGPRPPF